MFLFFQQQKNSEFKRNLDILSLTYTIFRKEKNQKSREKKNLESILRKKIDSLVLTRL